MKGSVLTPLVRVALGLEALGFMLYSITPRQGAGWVFGIAAVVMAVIVDTLANSSVRRLTAVVDGLEPGRLDSYSITGWRPFLTKRDRAAWRATHDPGLLELSDAKLDLQRAREMIPLGAAAGVIVCVFLLGRIWLAFI